MLLFDLLCQALLIFVLAKHRGAQSSALRALLLSPCFQSDGSSFSLITDEPRICSHTPHLLSELQTHIAKHLQGVSEVSQPQRVWSKLSSSHCPNQISPLQEMALSRNLEVTLDIFYLTSHVLSIARSCQFCFLNLALSPPCLNTSIAFTPGWATIFSFLDF